MKSSKANIMPSYCWSGTLNGEDWLAASHVMHRKFPPLKGRGLPTTSFITKRVQFRGGGRYYPSDSAFRGSLPRLYAFPSITQAVGSPAKHRRAAHRRQKA
jgi:hypothetical protein